ncbi:MAG: fructose-1,6-bisphosphatase [Clostridiaceae bacterium]|nr:fructose-1,6-bisphosphatase [Clostridiaceae bacterium]
MQEYQYAKHLELLSQHYPTIEDARGKIVYLETLLSLPKGTEYFFSDLHGEADAFINFLHSASGSIRNKIKTLFHRSLTEEEQNDLAFLTFNPRLALDKMEEAKQLTDETIKITIFRLIDLLKYVSSKYPLQRVEEKTPKAYRAIIHELLNTIVDEEDSDMYNQAIINAIIKHNAGRSFITVLCEMIQSISVDELHIIGDIFDRGPEPDRIMDVLMEYPNVDIQWGNHDIIWMAAAAGSEVAIMSVIRIAIRYNNFDVLEDGYGINLRPLYSYATQVYADDPCERFIPRSFEDVQIARIDPEIAAKMQKMVAIMEMKLEGQLLERNPDFHMDNRNVLKKVDFEKNVYIENGKEYPLLDTNFPTIDPKDPLALSPEESDLLASLKISFASSMRLQKHIDFVYQVGSMYKVHNHNLLYHGCIPMDDKGNLDVVNLNGKKLKGKALMDYIYEKVRDAWFSPRHSKKRNQGLDLMWYLWCGKKSPLFGKDKMATFERYFIADKSLHVEKKNPYYEFSKEVEGATMILEEFGLTRDFCRIINGHVPVKLKDGETPVRANGKLFVIDGGLSKPYQSTTGIAGYTLIFTSHELALAEHHQIEGVYESGSYIPEIHVVREMPYRLRIVDTDEGAEIKAQIKDLEGLIEAYSTGKLRTKR